MVYGEYPYKIDKKNRMCIPTDFREYFGEKCMVCRGLDAKPCLYIYPMDEWEKLDAYIKSMPLATSRTIRKFVFAGAAELDFDGQGRLLLPAHLREYAGLTDEVVVVGQSDYAAIWNPEKWDEEQIICSPENAVALLESWETKEP